MFNDWSRYELNRGMEFLKGGNMKKSYKVLLLVVSLLFVFSIGQAFATSSTYFFNRISGDPDPGAGVLIKMTVTNELADMMGKDVAFVFNYGFSVGAITQIAFYDSPLLDFTTLATSSTGTVNMVADTTPPFAPNQEVPGANGYFDNEAAMLATTDAINPPVENGIGTGESYTMLFDMLGLTAANDSIDDVILALNKTSNPSTPGYVAGPYTSSNPFPDPGLSVAIKVQGLPGSTEYVSFVPLPGAVLLLGAGLVRLAAYARRREED